MIKKAVVLFVSVLLLFSFCGCEGGVVSDETVAFGEEFLEEEDNSPLLSLSGGLRGVWLSYLELQNAPKSSKAEFEEYIGDEFEKLAALSINSVFVQVRPFADAIYPSRYFPSAACVAKKQGEELLFDFFAVIVEVAHRNSLAVHAWINPYRILPKGEGKDSLSSNSPGKTMKEPDVVNLEEGLFFSPASQKAQRLVILGVREILENYSIEGIHIDDYFYPTTNESIDGVQYESYRHDGGRLSLPEWRRENVNSLVRGIYLAVHENEENKIFSISPCGNIEKNMNVYFADVEKWGSESGYCDLLIPQIYFGFENESLPFDSCAEEWRKLVKNEGVALCGGLALYKVGKEDLNAGENGRDEWLEEKNILSRQVKALNEKNYDGFCLYSLQFVNFNEKLIADELKSLKDVL